MSMTDRIARLPLPRSALVAGRKALLPMRYSLQLARSRWGYVRYGSRYPQNVLFVAGLPKSGTSWLKRMLTSYPGFSEILIPEANTSQWTSYGTAFELPEQVFERFQRRLVVTKMHTVGTPENVEVLEASGVRYVVLVRDLRDVALSHHHYVVRTPWHFDHEAHRGLEVGEGVRRFAAERLDVYGNWVRSWLANRNPERSLMVRYEDLLENPHRVVGDVARLFDLDSSESTIAEIVDRWSFSRMSGGRQAGQEDPHAFVRKGVAGDWSKQFDDDLKSEFKACVGDVLIDLGYEHDDTW